MKDEPLIRLQRRTIVDTALVLRGTRKTKALTNRLRSRLIRAFKDEVLKQDYSYLVREASTIQQWNGKSEKMTAIIGGVETNLKRDPTKAHFRRTDDAWFDFHMIVRDHDGDAVDLRGCLELVAYGYEIRFSRRTQL